MTIFERGRGALAITLAVAFAALGAPAAAQDRGSSDRSRDESPRLRIVQNFRAGLWVATDSDGRRHSHCLHAGVGILTGGHVPKMQCNFVIVENTDELAVITYRCPNGLSGRTRARRDTDTVYSVSAQGILAGRPFANQSEWRFAGACR